MLSREEALTRLEAYKRRDGAAPGLAQRWAARRSEPLLSALVDWIGRGAGDPAQLGGLVDGLAPGRRRQLFDALVPVQALAVDHWWAWARQTPYQSGWSRRGFRSPRPEDSLEARMRRLAAMVPVLLAYPQPVEWHAAWATYTGLARSGGELFAAEIARGNTGVATVLTDQAAGRDEVGGMDAHVIAGLLGATDPRSWQVVADLLRTAGRQEGLRQSILEQTDLAGPGARRMVLQVVQEDGLTRFASVVRAVGVWFGEAFEIRQDEQVRDHLAVWGPMLERPPTAGQLLALPAPDAFLGLHARALTDARGALGACEELLRSGGGPAYAEHRLAAVRLVSELDLPESAWLLVEALRDPDLRVVAAAVGPLRAVQHALHRVRLPAVVVAPVVADLDRYGPPQPLQIGLLGLRQAVVGTGQVADALVTLLHDDIVDVLAPAYVRTTAEGRATRLRWLARQPERHRAVLMELLGDSSEHLRRQAADALERVDRVTTEEALDLEALLTREVGSLRTTVLDFLTRQEPVGLAATIDRLEAGDAEQQRAAAELRGGADEARTPPSSRVRAALNQLDVPARARTPGIRRQGAPFAATYPAVAGNAQRLVDSLTTLLSEHGSQEVLLHGEPALLSNLQRLGRVEPGGQTGLEKLLDPWWHDIAPSLTLGGLELLLIDQLTPVTDDPWAARVAVGIVGGLSWPRLWEGSRLAATVVGALARRELRVDWALPYLHALSEAAAALDVRRLAAPADVRRARGVAVEPALRQRSSDSRALLPLFGGDLTVQLAELGGWDDGHWPALWSTLRHVDEPEGARDLRTGPTLVLTADEQGRPAAGTAVIDQPDRWRPATVIAARAFLSGAATQADLVDALLGEPRRRLRGHWNRGSLADLTSARPPVWAEDPRIAAVVDHTVAALLDVELERGDLPTRYTEIVSTVQRLTGLDTLLRLLRALDGDRLASTTWGPGRSEVLSRLLRRCVPGPDDVTSGVPAVLAAGLGERRLIELALFAPQWAGLVEVALGWPGLESGVWWLLAHSPSRVTQREHEDDLQLGGAAAISRWTPLAGEDLLDGATDIAWFARVRSELGDERLNRLLDLRADASDGYSHERAQLFAQALRGEIREEDSQARADKRRHQDSLRALGLIPLPDREGRSDAVLRRYEFLSGYVKTHKGGSQRKASETRAVEIGLQNLARTAGYADPQRLVWAMESHAVRDLAAGPVSASHDDLVVTLSLTEAGLPEIDVRRGRRSLKAVPAPSRKHPDIANLTSRVAALRTQRSRMRDSLEASCVRGDEFDRDEWTELFTHPMLRPMLRELVVVSGEGVLGFADDPHHVISADGERVELDGSPVRIVHPLDLLEAGCWPDFQHRLFEARRTQPFKQVFREVYTPTQSERAPGHTSRRYAGQQIQPRSAAGLFRARNWVVDYGSGFEKTYHRAGLTVWCSMLDGFGSPGEVEDATVGEVWFLAGRERLPLDEVPARLFSETMRDLDLVVSVAHSGGVDPETSESAVELRRRLVEETCLMLKAYNVTTTDHHAEIRGTLATYSVNLGSGVVHRRPGSAVCIIPVSAQHRGRVFLPFADDDPKTAEVISKVLLLAKDDTIKDPTILAQLR